MMCGLFAFVGAKPQRAQLLELAALAGRRGPHACGWFLFNERESLERHLGSSEDHADKLPHDVRVLIGNSRLATSGEHDDLASSQPCTADGYALVHNGIARLKEPGPVCETSCDSKALLRIMIRTGALTPGLKAAALALEENTPFALIAMRGNQLVAMRRGLPLYARETDEGAYLCSVTFDGARPLPALALSTWTAPAMELAHAE